MSEGLRRLAVVVVGEEAAGAQVLRLVASSGHRVVAVLTDPTARMGGVAGLRETAAAFGLPVLEPILVTKAEFASTMRREGVDLLLNVHSLFIAHPAVARAPAIGSFNLHPGPLPEFAGLNTPSWAIYLGEPTHGVTLHWMTESVDAGPIVDLARFPIGPTDTGLSVSLNCVRRGLPLIGRLLHLAATDPAAIPKIPQDFSRRRYFGRAAPHGGAIRWSDSADRIARLARACRYAPFISPWGHPRATWRGRDLEVLDAVHAKPFGRAPPGTVRLGERGSVLVAAGEGWVEVRRIRFDGSSGPAGEILRNGARLDDGRPPAGTVDSALIDD